MKLLVTGGAGFIGSNFINYWLSKYPKDTITNLDLMTYAANPLTIDYHVKNFGSRYEFVKGSILDANLVNNLVAETDIVVHFAAESHVDRSVTDPGNFVNTNVVGTFTLLDAARKNGNKRFHHISTDEVFGTLELNSSDKFSEKTPYSPRSPYSASKAGSDHLVYAYYETYNMPVTITNCSNNYGPFQFPEKVIPLYITRALYDKNIPIYGQGIAIRDYLYVEDHCSAIESVIFNGKLGQTYCVGGDSERNTVEVSSAILDSLGKDKNLIKHTTDRPGHDPRYSIDHTKISTDLGWSPKYSFDDGIQLTIDWYKNNEAWWQPISAKAQEIAERYLQNVVG
ncbi:MAG: dTDP-glucose 4,6-dehydratase [bacterium]